MTRPDDLKFKTLKSNINRIRSFAVIGVKGFLFLHHAMTWQITPQTTIGFTIGWTLFWIFAQPWHLAFGLLFGTLFIGMQKFRGKKSITGLFETDDNDEQEQEEEEEEEDIDDDAHETKQAIKNPIGFSTQVHQLRVMARTAQNLLGEAASFLERIRNLFEWESPVLTAIFCTGVFFAAVLMIFIPLRYFILLLGWNRIVRTGLRKYHPAFKRPMYYKPIFPPIEFIERVPDDLEVEQRKLLPLPENLSND